MPKKSNTRRADGRVQVKVYLGLVDGKKKYKYVYGKTQKEANEKAEAVKASLKKGIEVTNDSDSFSKWADYWLSMKKSETSQDQYNLIKSRAEVFKQYIGDAKMTRIKPFELQQVIDELSAENPYTGKPSAKKTLRSYIQILCAVFEFAADNRIIEYNPAAKLKTPQNAAEKKRRALTETERQRVAEFEHRAQPSAMLMMYSGLRRGEATALTWNDVDLEKGTITVSRSYNFKQNEFKAPKNGKSRTVIIPQVLTDYLKTLPKTSVYVLTSKSGKMMTDTAWKRLYESYMYDLNLYYGGFTEEHKKFEPRKIPMVIEPFTPHELRHTFCTIMYEAGVDVVVAKEQMGHSDVKTTLAIYTHLSAKHKKNDINKLNAYLNKAAETEANSNIS